MKLRRLRHALHARDLRQHFSEQARRVQQLKGAPRAAFGEHLGELVAHALAADGMNPGCERTNRSQRSRFDLESEPGGETHGAQEAELVFLKASRGLADGAEYAGVEVCEAADVIQHRAAQGLRIVE